MPEPNIKIDHTGGTIPKSNIKIDHTGGTMPKPNIKVDILCTQVNYRTLSLLGTGIVIKCGRVKLVLRVQTSILSEMR